MIFVLQSDDLKPADFHVSYIQEVHEYPFEDQIPEIKDADWKLPNIKIKFTTCVYMCVFNYVHSTTAIYKISKPLNNIVGFETRS